MERVSIRRQGSYFYARAYWKVVLFLTLIYGGMGAVLALVTESDLEDVLEVILFPILAFIPVLMMWLVYALMLWAFKREAGSGIEMSADGIREIYKERERMFIPWAGVREVELDADLIGGTSLRVKGNFSEISISNVDLVITQPMSLFAMHRALGQTGEIRKLFAELKSAAPDAALKMNNLARRRMSRYRWADSDTRS
ncbi:MAG: hypothetical protein WBV94_01145 [Blastocatellia bacterium]